MADITQVQRLVGTWDVLAPALGDVPGTMTVEPVLDGTAFLQRVDLPVPGAPSALCVLAADEVRDTLVQHYFDSRGVTRVYVMTLDEHGWTLTRDAPDFTELPFRQRFTSTFTGDGRTLEGRWERTDPDPDGPWITDFALTFRRRS